ncbi:tetratricopeptide repeat protein [Sphingobium aquiterrae]|uniref:tetratricopeptide repeat protein n=1 Tax=Sphingobium aquiterrae TaxID=2038656 RepID=UPI003019D708
MMRPLHVALMGAALLGAASPFSGVLGAEPPTVGAIAPPDDLAQVEEALDAGRLVQADVMLGRLGADAAMRQTPRFRVAFAALAVNEGKAQTVVGDLEALKAAGDTSCRLLEALGTAYLRTGRDEDAIASLEPAVASCPERWRAWEALGMAHDRRAQWQESARAFERAFRWTNHPARIANNYGVSLLRQGRAAEAANLFAEAIRLDAANPRYQSNEDAAHIIAGLPLRRLGEDETTEATAERLADASRVASGAGLADRARALSAQALTTAEYYGADGGLDRLAKDGL